MKKLTLQHNQNNYEIMPTKDSTWQRVLKDDEVLALCMDLFTAYQVIYTDINKTSKIGFLSEGSFKKVMI